MIIACKCSHLMEVREVLEEVFYTPEIEYTFWDEMYKVHLNIIIYVNLEEYGGKHRYEWDHYDSHTLKRIELNYPEEIFLDITNI